jgi:hypothetical protein
VRSHIEHNFDSDSVIYLYLAASPRRIEAKTEAYGRHPYAIHINTLHPSFETSESSTILISHEAYHALQAELLDKMNSKIDYSSVWGRLVAEGMAIFFSRGAAPQWSLCQVTYLKDHECRLIDRQIKLLAKQILKDYDCKDYKCTSKYFGYGISDFPPRSAYYLGSLITQELSHKIPFKKMTQLSAEDLKRMFKEQLIKTAH